VPVSDPGHPTPTFIRLLSAGTVKTFVVTSVANPEHLVEVSRRLRLDGRSHLLRLAPDRLYTQNQHKEEDHGICN
jgi:hypothetical protein